MSYKKEFGAYGEETACDYLFNTGYSIIERNFTCKVGEIDIIAMDHSQKEDELVFVEVKTRSDNKYGRPAEAVNEFKKRHLYKAAEYYLMINHLESIFCRFDVIEILNEYYEPLQINHIKNAIIDKPA